ncbi:MAG TPA: hypothetical protein VFO41_13775 [Alphaproteobacteria bacterium]|nr:hypothetical protein [Alphaproteobacteria bacterium]
MDLLRRLFARRRPLYRQAPALRNPRYLAVHILETSRRGEA